MKTDPRERSNSVDMCYEHIFILRRNCPLTCKCDPWGRMSTGRVQSLRFWRLERRIWWFTVSRLRFESKIRRSGHKHEEELQEGWWWSRSWWIRGWVYKGYYTGSLFSTTGYFYWILYFYESGVFFLFTSLPYIRVIQRLVKIYSCTKRLSV